MRSLPAVIALVAGWTAAATGAHACSIVAAPPGTPLPGEVVFVGTVESVPGATTDLTGSVAYTFRVERVLRGAADPSVTVLTAASGAACGAYFSAGGRYLVSASRVSGPSAPGFPAGALSTGLGSGNRPLEPGVPVPEDALVWPAPSGFSAARSTMTFSELRRFRLFPVAELAHRTNSVRALLRTRNSVTVVYDDLALRTTHLCRPRAGERAAPLAPAPGRLRNAGVREGRLVVFAGREEVRFGRLAPARALRFARALVRADGARALPPPGPGVRSRVPCPVPR